MTEGARKTRQPRAWELALRQKAQRIALPILEADETVEAAAHWRSGLPAIAQMLLLGSLLGIPLVIIWQSRIGRGIVAVTQQRLLKIDLKKNELVADWLLSEISDFDFVRRPLVDDKFVWSTDKEGELALQLTGDWSSFERSLEEQFSALD